MISPLEAGVQLAAQAADLHVDGAVEDVGCRGRGPCSSSWSRDRIRCGWSRKTPQQRELAGGQQDGGAVGRPQLAAHVSTHEALELVGLAARGRAAAHLLQPPEHRAHPGQQLARAAGLGQVVVGAQLQAQHPVDLLAHGADHDDGRPAVGRQPPADGQAVLARQHHVQHDQVDGRRGQRRSISPRVGRGVHLVAVLGEVAGHLFAQLGVVVDDQDVAGGKDARAEASWRDLSRRTVALS